MAQQAFDFNAPYHDDKEQLLDEMRPHFEPPARLSGGTLIISMILFIVLLSILMPKIYLRNTIYYKSRDVAKLEHEYDILYEERELLKAKVESLRFKNQVQDLYF